jgi:xanthine dehydrogenase accessory factor
MEHMLQIQNDVSTSLHLNARSLMKELNDIIIAYDKAVLQNKKMALVTVVKVEGSSYRRPGARMLVTEDGQITGAISGGCLEGDALRKAQLAMHQQQNKLEIYDTTDDEDERLGVQLGCNGIVYILFEPIKNENENNPVNLLKMVAAKREDAVLVTIFNENKFAEQKGTCCFINDEEVLFFFDDVNIKTDGKIILQQKISLVKEHEGCSVLYQFVPPSIQIIIVGAGNDAQPLADMAFLLGWSFVVVDGRPAYANRQRFSKANNVCVVKASDFLDVVSIDEQTAVVLMTHNYNYDIGVLEQLIRTNCNYIGLLGPKKKLDKMLFELAEKGSRFEDQRIHKIYGPVGLDIGAETSEEIALAIVAEIKAVFSKRNGASLKERGSEIHERAKASQHG